MIKNIFKYLFTIFLIIVFCILIMLLSSKYVFKDKIPNAFGYSILRVVSGSMEPNIKIGDFVVIKKCDNYKVGDIVRFSDEHDEVVTHRIIKIENDLITTKGDANNTDDGEIPISNIHGKVVTHFNNLFTSKRKIIYILLGLFIFGGIVTIFIPNRKK